MESLAVPKKLWEHPDPQSTEMYKLMQEINSRYNLQLNTYWQLYQYSITKRSQFWDQTLQFLQPIYSGSYTQVVDESARIDSVPRWFDGVSMNFAENMLYSRAPGTTTSKRGTAGKEDNKVALTEVREGYTDVRDVTWGQLRQDVGRLASAMKAHGVGKGDRVVVVASNSVDTLMVFLAVSWLGGMFSSSSTDMGVQGILQRTLQVEPKHIFMDDYTIYNGKKLDLRSKMKDIVDGMKDVKEFKGMVSVPRFKESVDISEIPRTETLSSYLSSATGIPDFERTAFHDPFFIAYSSGTTGIPKCIVHSIGGAILSTGKELRLHREINSSSKVLQYTTTGWIMYFLSVACLGVGAHVVLYDGSPFQPDLTTFVRMIGELKVSMLGTSPKWMQEMAKNNIKPREITDLSNLKVVSSTGMVLSDQLFEWFYDSGFPKHVQLANISGGTDLAGCFGQENPLTPVYVGGTSGPSLGTPVAVYDSLIDSGKGEEVPHGTPGELVAPLAFPNMPVAFWNDAASCPSPKSKYFSAYFEKYDNVWTHGDFVMIHPVTKSLVFLGRADGVLNPSGVRFGSAEIYSVLEAKFTDRVTDSICVGQRRPQDQDESVVLFLMMKEGCKFDLKLVDEVKTAIRRELSARHVPKYVFQTPDIPTTVNGKKVELPVKQIVSGKIIKPSGTLLNPQSLDYYYQFAKIEEMAGPTSKL